MRGPPGFSGVPDTGAWGIMETSPSLNAELWVVIPAYNEEGMIQPVVREVRGRCLHVVVVDDASSDGTASRAAEAGATVLSHPINLGQGAALQTGIQYALQSGAPYVATFDADGQHHIDDAVRMLEVVKSERLDVALGSRFMGQTINMPASRRLLLRAAVHFSKLTSGLNLSDAHNGLRVFTADAATRIRITQSRMAHASEIVAQIGREGLRWKEVPVTIEYTEYSLAKGQKMTNALDILRDLFAGWITR